MALSRPKPPSYHFLDGYLGVLALFKLVGLGREKKKKVVRCRPAAAGKNIMNEWMNNGVWLQSNMRHLLSYMPLSSVVAGRGERERERNAQ